MATQRRFGSRTNRGISTRRKTAWLDGPSGNAQLTTPSVAIFTFVISALLPGLTLIRVRGDLNTFQQDTSGADNLQGFERIGVGLCIQAEQAVAAGATALPRPLTDIDWDGWLWHSVFSCVARGLQVVPNNQGPASNRIVIDGKAMRKWKETDLMIAMIETTDELNVGDIRSILNTRLLVKLP